MYLSEEEKHNAQKEKLKREGYLGKKVFDWILEQNDEGEVDGAINVERNTLRNEILDLVR